MSAHRQIWPVVAAALSLILGQGRFDAAEPQPGDFPVPVKRQDELKFKHASFTFVRIKYSVRASRSKAREKAWATDYPNSERNLSARFATDTGLKTDSDGKVLMLTDPELKRYPFIYIVEGGLLQLSDDEARSLRDYLLGGGFLMVDDFWGEFEWKHFYDNIKRVFPEREPQELPLDHPLFHCYYEIAAKPQVPNILAWQATGRSDDNRRDTAEVHYRALFDDKGRMMALMCHNTDIGDGWERAGVNESYFREVSQKKAYPMGINILVYALTH